MSLNEIYQESEIQIALYVLNKFKDSICDQLRLFKIIYFANREHLARYGKPLFRDTFIKMKNGPVPSRLYDITKSNSRSAEHGIEVIGYYLIANKQADLDYISESERETLDNAYNSYWNYNFKELSNISHDFAWNNARKNRPMDLYDIAKAGGANSDMIEYIAFHNEKIIFGAECLGC